MLKDSEGVSVTQKMTLLNFTSITPPMFDVEALKQWQFKNDELDYPDKYMICGFSRGSIVFVSTKDLEKIYARFSFHREAIKAIVELQHKGHFASFCAENILVIWGFSHGDEKVSAFQTFTTMRPISFLCVCAKRLSLGFNSGDNVLFEWKGSK